MATRVEDGTVVRVRPRVMRQETKTSFLTTEFYAFVATVAAL